MISCTISIFVLYIYFYNKIKFNQEQYIQDVACIYLLLSLVYLQIGVYFFAFLAVCFCCSSFKARIRDDNENRRINPPAWL